MSNSIYRIEYTNGIALVEATATGIADHLAQLPTTLSVVSYRKATFDELQRLFSAGHFVWKQCETSGCTNEADGLVDDYCQQCWENHCAALFWKAGTA